MMQTQLFEAESVLFPKPIEESYWVIAGRLLAGEYPCMTSTPELTVKRLSAFLNIGINTFINLTTEGEKDDYFPLLKIMARQADVEVNCLRFPILDFGLPSPAFMASILDAIDLDLTTGRNVYLHCHGGIGRTGTTVGCFLVRHGYSGDQALRQLANWWMNVPKSSFHPNSPETPEQAQFIRAWDEKLG